MGLTFADFDHIETGEIIDLMIESGNDDYEYPELATQEDFDRF